MDAIRRLSGVCPQHDLAFAALSALENLQLAGAVKGLSPAQALLSLPSPPPLTLRFPTLLSPPPQGSMGAYGKSSHDTVCPSSCTT